MMTREERIDYEILDCAINGAWGSNGYATTVPRFMKRLQALFPDSVVREFTDACKRLLKRGVLHVGRFDHDLAGFRDYQADGDDATFFDANSDGICLRASGESQKYFSEVSMLIAMPFGFKGHKGMDIRPWPR